MTDVTRAKIGTPAVSATNVRKAFGSKEVLCDISLTINHGEVVSLIGPSGAGKSTMLRCLTLLDTFDAGRLCYGDIEVCAPSVGTDGSETKAEYSKKAMREARMRFGLVFQNFNLFPHFSVLRNVCDAPISV